MRSLYATSRKRAVHGVDVALRNARDQRFGAAAILDEIGDRADLQLVLGSELDEIGEPRHLAVVLQDLADDRRGREPGEPREIAAGLGVAGAHEHAALLRHQRKDVSGLHEVLRARVGADRRLHRARAVRGRDACRDAFGRFDRDREIGAERRAVVVTMSGRLSCAASLFGQREADQAAAVARHEVDGVSASRTRPPSRDRLRSRGLLRRRARPCGPPSARRRCRRRG